jgi:hypothetical protein
MRGFGQFLSIPCTVLVVGLLAEEARAGDYSFCECSVADSPADGATGVPLNPILMFRALAPDKPNSVDTPGLHLESGEGVVVPLEEATDITDCYFISKPIQDLAPETTYQVWAEDRNGELLATFTTGSERDNAAPAVTVIDDGIDSGRFVFEAEEEVVLVVAECPIDMGIRHVLASPSGGAIELPCDGIELLLYDASGNADIVNVPEIPDASESCGCHAVGARTRTALPAICLAVVVVFATSASRRRRFRNHPGWSTTRKASRRRIDFKQYKTRPLDSVA